MKLHVSDILSRLCNMLAPPEYANLYCSSKEFLTCLNIICKPVNQVVTTNINSICSMSPPCWADIRMETAPTVDELMVLDKCKIWKLNLSMTSIINVSACKSVHIFIEGTYNDPIFWRKYIYIDY